ncbi:transporter substrate-binding domain-containing protein [Acuticoccus sp. M5D2P5]|uniref:transporter substrate-binding domain-containing protein n=1 Tax=Acuticoccus kalidii TaxID=2910977 RepID=UPI001F432C61|nr:transporter substrate-binding domain-containing protein [Acuticoccus kalidii]MCF3936151.1 transporter substrate-binding domain-containing protein [Acuticoccus kalidii]
MALDLDDAERSWLEANRRVSVGVVSDNEPYSFFRNGQTMGWTVDVLRRVADIAGFEFNIRLGTWPEIYDSFRKGGIDVIADISQTAARNEFINFTDAYHLRRTVVFHNVGHPFVDPTDLDAMRQKRIGVIKDIYYGTALREAGFDLVEYDSYRDLMAALAFGWVDAALAAEMTGQFFARENGFSNIAVAGTLPLAGVTLEDFHLGTLKTGDADGAIRSQILSKAVAALSTEDLAAITEEWLAYRTGRNPTALPLRLLPEEQAFIAEAPPLKIGFISDYEPFSFLSAGVGQGFAVDLAHEISARTGLVLEPVFDNWSTLLDNFQAGDLDIISNISFTEDRAAYTLFSREYHRIPNTVFVRSGFGPYRGLDSLVDKRVGIGKGIYYADTLQARLSNVVTYETQDDILKGLAAGEVDVAIMALSNGNAIIRKLGLINIEIGGEFLMDGIEREDLRYGISPQFPYARSIIDRAMSAIPFSRWNELETRWLGPAFASLHSDRAPLTMAERDYLSEKGVIKACIDPDMAPYTAIDKDGKFTGIAAEVMNHLANRGGFTWQAVPVDMQSNPFAATKGLDCDVLPFAMVSGPSSDDWQLTLPYLVLPMVVAAPLQHPFVESVSELAGERVGVVAGRGPYEMLRERYPGVRFEEVESEEAGIQRVRDGELDATVGTLATLGYLIAATNVDDIKISGRIDESWRAVIATRADEPLLGSLFSKLVAGLDENEVRSILNQRILVQIEEDVNYTRLVQLGLVALLALAMVVYWNRKLHRLNVALNATNQKLHEVSITDSLTGLYNRHHFDERGREEFSLCARNGWLFSIAMIDVDHFKPINDEMGHVFGDLCLKHIADVVRAHFPKDGEIVARYGGEEFVIFTMGGTAEDFVTRLEGLRAGVANGPVMQGDATRSLTISIGCHAGVPSPDQSLDDVIKRADGALYEAKDRGRNQLVAEIDGRTALRAGGLSGPPERRFNI